MKEIDYKLTGASYIPINDTVSDKLKLIPILDTFEALFDFITVDGRRVVIQTDLNAPMYKLIVVDLDNPARVS